MPTCQCDMKTHTSVADVWAQASWTHTSLTQWQVRQRHSPTHRGRTARVRDVKSPKSHPPTHPPPLLSALLSSAASETLASSAAGASSTTPRLGPPLDGARRPGRVHIPSPISPSRSRISPSRSHVVATLDRCLASRSDASRTRRPSIYHWCAAEHRWQARRRGADGRRVERHRGPARHRRPTRRRSTDGRRGGSSPTRRWLLPEDLHHANSTTIVLLPPCSIDVEFCCARGTFMYGSCVNWI
jgi:hypothetical protein